MISYAPRNLTELAVDLNKLTPEGKILAGGTDLIIAMQEKKTNPDSLLYIGNVKETREISLAENTVFIGSSLTMTDIANFRDFPENLIALKEAASNVGSLQIRNRATIGGNIANASAAGDLIPVLCLLDAKAHILNSDGTTTVSRVFDLLKGSGKNTLKYNQAIYKFELPYTDMITHFYKLGFRKHVSIARFGMCFGFNFDLQKNIRYSKIIVSAISDKPVFFNHLSSELAGKNIGDPQIVDIITDAIVEHIKKTTGRKYKIAAAKGPVADVVEMFKK